MGPFALIPLLLLAQTHSRWEASVRTEVRARSATPVEGTGAAGDGELRPRLSGALFNGPWTLSGSYSPTFRTREPYKINNRNGRPYGDHSHTVAVEGVWSREASARAFVGEFVNYGTLDLSSLNRETTAGPGPAPAPSAQPVIGLGQVQELTSDTSAGVDWYLTRRVTLTTTAGFTWGGGVTNADQQTLPLQSSPRGAIRLAWLASQLDTLALSLTGQFVRFDVAATPQTIAYNGTRLVILELAAHYGRLLAPETRAELTLGLTSAFGKVLSVERAGVPRVFSDVNPTPAPLVAAGISHREQLKAQRFDFRLSGSYSPFVDRFAGSVYQRLEAGAALGWSNAHHVSGSLASGVGIPVGAGTAPRTVYAEAGAGYQGDPWWRVDLSSRLSVVPPASTARLDPSWVVGLSLTLIAASDQPQVTAQAE